MDAEGEQTETTDERTVLDEEWVASRAKELQPRSKAILEFLCAVGYTATTRDIVCDALLRELLELARLNPGVNLVAVVLQDRKDALTH
ncbi:hypothetical protein SAMN05216226_12023 [Halovenus aranensis]|uniref:Uncharacterized protein n=1 Tax=Halovenus aranensis TaxID=890420 RepID=A0A1G8ZBM3_9EURY|nr:hypothetical protein [Halovenus aranensis]SDK12481.1 hypothetical protein SAMN05216226_12023 [Halovenus aranensis]